jgi:hypothetical protein
LLNWLAANRVPLTRRLPVGLRPQLRRLSTPSQKQRKPLSFSDYACLLIFFVRGNTCLSAEADDL